MKTLFLVFLILIGFSFGSYKECTSEVERGNLKKALSLSKSLVEEGKKYEGFFCLSDVASALGEYRLAIKYARLALEEAKTPDQKIAVSSSLFKLLLDVGDLKTARKVLNFMIETINKLEAPNDLLKYAVLFNIALYYQHSGDYEKALEYYSKALEVAPPDGKFSVYNNVALLYAHMDRFEKAVEFYKKALEHARTSYNKALALVNLGIAYINLKNFKEAERVLTEGVKIGNNFGLIKALGYYHLGRLYVLKEDYRRAISALKVAVKLAKALNLKDLLSPAESLLTVALERREDIFVVGGLEDEVFKVAFLTVKGEGDRYLKVSTYRVRNREDLQKVYEFIGVLKKMKNLRKLELYTTEKGLEGFSKVSMDSVVKAEFNALIPSERRGNSLLIRIGYDNTYFVYMSGGELKLIKVPYGMISASDFSKSGAEFFKFIEFLVKDEFYQAIVFEGGRALRNKKYVYLIGDIGVFTVAAAGDKDLTPLKEKRITLTQLNRLVKKLKDRLGEIYLQTSEEKVAHLDMYELYAGAYLLKGILELLGKKEVLYRNYADWITLKALRESLTVSYRSSTLYSMGAI